MHAVLQRWRLILRHAATAPPPRFFASANRTSWLIQMHLLVLIVLVAIIAILLAGQERYYQLYAVMLVVALALFFNLICFALLRLRASYARPLVHAMLFFDIIIITIFVHFTGGLISLFSMAYFLIIVASSIFIAYNTGFITALYCFFAFAGIVMLEYYGIVESYPLYDVTKQLPNDYLYVYITVYLSGLLFYTVALMAGQVQRFITTTQTSMAQLEKMHSLGRLAAGVAHEVNNPLSNILSWLDSRETTGQALDQGGVTLIRGELRRATDTLGKLLAFARPAAAATPPHADANAVITETAIILKAAGDREKVVFDLQLEPDLPAIRLGAAALKEIIINLVLNAVDALAAAPERRLTVATRRAGATALLTVRDTGCGIAPENIPQLFEPFFTTKPVGKGTGLGLFLVYGLVNAAGGTIGVDSTPGRGTAITITLPLAA